MTRRTLAFLLVPLFFLSACSGNGQSKTQAAAKPDHPVNAATAGTITGTVSFTGTPPKPQKINMSADSFCKMEHTSDIWATDVVISKNSRVQWVYVYVKSGLDAAYTFPAPAEPAMLDQKGCLYHPHVLAVRADQPITIRNSDAVLHNVNARPASNTSFNIGQPVKGMQTTKSFSKPEVMIPLKCDVHPWMNAFIGVQDHPYAAVTDENGTFTLPNLPPGDYEIEAWHEKFGAVTQKVKIGAKENKTIEFTFKGA